MRQKTNTMVLTIVTLVLCSNHFVYGQKENTQKIGFYKNAIYGSIGTTGFFASATSYYERMIAKRGKISSFVKVGAGTYETWGGNGTYVLAQYGILTGVKKHHLELGVGPTYFIKGNVHEGLSGTATIGWRVQKPGESFMFRMGVSFPESIYIGIGISF